MCAVLTICLFHYQNINSRTVGILVYKPDASQVSEECLALRSDSVNNCWLKKNDFFLTLNLNHHLNDPNWYKQPCNLYKYVWVLLPPKMLLSNFPSLNSQEHFTRVHEVIWLYKKFKYLNVSFIIKQKCHCHINPSAICFCFWFSFYSKAWLFSTVPYTHDVVFVSTGTYIFLRNGKLLMRPIFIIFFFLFLSLKHLKTADFSKTSTAQLLYFCGFICQNKTIEACFGKPIWACPCILNLFITELWRCSSNINPHQKLRF